MPSFETRNSTKDLERKEITEEENHKYQSIRNHEKYLCTNFQKFSPPYEAVAPRCHPLNVICYIEACSARGQVDLLTGYFCWIYCIGDLSTPSHLPFHLSTPSPQRDPLTPHHTGMIFHSERKDSSTMDYMKWLFSALRGSMKPSVVSMRHGPQNCKGFSAL